VVVEARERSGALITADLALEEGREVFAVPGEITSALSTGSNRLLRSGAAALTCAADVLEVYGIEPDAPAALPDLSEAATRIVASLEVEPTGADALARELDLDAGELAAALTELELAGILSERDGFFRLVRPLGCPP
jgi:DNA processing protein